MLSYSHGGLRHYVLTEVNVDVADTRRHCFCDITEPINLPVHMGFGELPGVRGYHAGVRDIYHYQGRRNLLGLEKLAGMGHPRDLKRHGV